MNDQQKRLSVKSIFGSFLALLVLATALPAFADTPPVAAELQASEASFQLRDGVIVDPARQRLYVMQKGGIAAYGMDGTPRWESDQAARPLGLFGDQLIALATSQSAHSAHIVFLRVSDGEVLGSLTAALPAPAGGWVVDRPHESFDARVIVSGGQVFLTWNFVGRPLSGARVVVAGQPEGGLIELDGTLRLDPVAGSATAVEAPAAPQTPAFRFDLAPEERLAGVTGRQFRAGDDRHVLGSDKLTATDGWNRYRWTLLDRQTGAVKGIVDRPVSTAAFFVADDTLIHEAQPHLRRIGSAGSGDEFEVRGTRLVGVDLGSGRDLWTIELRDTVYRGAAPP